MPRGPGRPCAREVRPARARAMCWAAVACVGASRLVPGSHAPGQTDRLPDPGDALVVAATAEPRSLLPPYAVDLVAGALCDLLYQRLAEPEPGFSPYGDASYRPALATHWRWGRDSLSIAFTLDPNARWHDGTPVTSRDVQFTYALWRSPDAAIPRSAPRDVDSVTTPDPRTAVVWLHRRAPTAFHDVTYPIHILPAHLLAGVRPTHLLADTRHRAPVGSGTFRFVRWIPGVQIELARYAPAVRATPSGSRRAAVLGPDRVIWRFVPSYAAGLNAFRADEVDVLDAPRPDDARRLGATPGVGVLRLPGFSYAALQFNLHAVRAPDPAHGPPSPAVDGHPLFADPRVRHAMVRSINRATLTAFLLHGMGAVSIGPVTRAVVTADSETAPVPFDTGAAGRLLDASGWRRATPGAVRTRDGHPLAFTLLVPNSSATRIAAAVVIQAMLARVGATVTVDRVDHATMIAALERHAFDAALVGIHVDPEPGGVADVWGGAAARSGRDFNYGAYANPLTDRLIAAAAAAPDLAHARVRYRRVYQQILADAPAVFLYEPWGLVAYARRWRPARVRADAWWAGLADWQRVH